MQKMEMLGVLAGGVAHDFNNLLQPIISLSDLLAERFEKGSQEHSYLTVIADAARSSRELVTQILAFSRLGHTCKSVHDFAAIIDDALKLVRSALSISTSINLNTCSESVPVYCDSSQIQQVLINLCLNAEQASPDGGAVQVTLDFREFDDYECFDGAQLIGRYARLAISDSGSGMDAATLSHIFEPSFTTRRDGRGAGFGLSTVSRIVRCHGGGIDVFTQSGKGSTFEVYLPTSELGPTE